jgi:fatty-acyl-CoA synthase
MSLESIIRPIGETRGTVRFVSGRGEAEVLTYDELGRRIVRAGAALAARGVEQGDAIGMVIDNNAESITAALGVWAAGATLVSLPPVPAQATEVYQAGFGPVLRAMSCSRVIGSPRLAEMAGSGVEAIDPASLQAGDGPDPGRAVEGIALVQFTSGSVGTPKGVALHAATLAGHLEGFGRAMEVDPATDRGVTWLPFYHDMGLVGTFLVPLAYAVPLTVLSPRSFVVHPRGWLDACADQRATLTAASDFAFRMAARAARGATGDLSSMRLCFTGGERVSFATLERFQEVNQQNGFPWESIMPVYGMSEAVAAVTMPPIGRGPVQDGEGNVSVGPPLAGVEVRLEETIAIRSPWLLDAYVRGDGQAPGVDSDGWFTTNDLGRQHDGEIYVLGRADEVVSAGGRNHFAEDVEAVALVVSKAALNGVAAFRAPDDPSRLALAIEVDTRDADEARTFGRGLQGSISAALGLRVGPVLLLRPWTIPRTTSGKVKRPACRALLAAGEWPERKVLAVID